MRGPSGPIPTAQVDKKAAKVARALAQHMIANVGDGQVIEHTKALAFHARRRLSPDELRRIDQAWLAIEPVDMG